MYPYEVRLARVICAFEPRIFFLLWSKFYVLALGRFVLCWCMNPKYTADVDAVFCDYFFCGFVSYVDLCEVCSCT